MNASMRDAFKAGSGVDPALMKTMVIAISIGVILVIAAWIVLQFTDAYRKDELASGDVIKAGIQLLVIVALLVFVIT